MFSSTQVMTATLPEFAVRLPDLLADLLPLVRGEPRLGEPQLGHQGHRHREVAALVSLHILQRRQL